MTRTIRTSGAPQEAVGPQQAWVWTVVPPAAAEIVVRGIPELAPAPPPAGSSRAEILGGPQAADAAAVAEAAARLTPGDVLAIVLPQDGGALERERRARGIAGSLQRDGFHVARLDTGDRSVRHDLAFRPTRPTLPRPGAHPILVVSDGEAPASTLRAAREAAEATIGGPLRPGRLRALAGGTLMLDVADPRGRRFLLRLATGGAARLLARSDDVVAALTAAAPPAVRRVLIQPLARGRVGAADWTLEPLVPGAAPRVLGPALRRRCLELLADLRTLPADAGPAGPTPRSEAADVEAHVGPQDAATLARVAEALEQRAGGLSPGWCHGDFWTANLLARRGRLVAVLDWDSACSDGPPLLDLLHLLAYADLRSRRMSHGGRCVRRLWPLARAGGDAAIRGYCAATSTPTDPAVLEALAVRYWLSRAARDLRTFSDRASRRDWMAANVHEPLAALREAGW